MLKLTIMLEEGFDDEKEEFVPFRSVELELEHSLLSLSKWESKYEKPFLSSKTEKTNEMLLDYIRMMILSDFDEKNLQYLSDTNISEINEYINSKQSAAWFPEEKKQNTGSTVTADVIYYWMVAMTIPFECETWHLNRLLTLIKITELENRPKKNMPRREAMSRHKSLNEARRAKSEQNRVNNG